MDVTLIHGNCLDKIKEIPDKTIDMILVDPPYKMTKRGKSCRPNWMPNNMGNNVFKGEIPKPKEWMSECYRVLKEETHLYTFCNTNDITEYLQVAQECGFKLHNIITMIKDTGMPNRWYLKNCELVLFFRKGKAKPINDMTSRDWVQVNMPTKKTGKFHITEKPLSFIQKIITNSSNEGDVVLDCFMGSGTTGIACLSTKRNFIGIELDDNYFKVAENRVKTYIKDNNLQDANIEIA